MQMILPAMLNPISRRKDKSVKLSYETRELSPEETIALMAMEGTEMWLCMAASSEELPDAPQEAPDLDTKSPATRLRSVLYILYQKAVDEGKYVGLFQSYYADRMEKIISQLKEKIDL